MCPSAPGSRPYRSQVLVWLDRFKSRMETFAPIVVMSMGDNSTATGAGNKTSLLDAVMAKLAENTAPHATVTWESRFRVRNAG